MRVIARPRKGGKTSELAAWVLADPVDRALLVRNIYAKQWVIRRFDMPTGTVYTVDELRERRHRGRFKTGWAVDDADMLLTDFLQVTIEAVALTGEADERLVVLGHEARRGDVLCRLGDNNHYPVGGNVRLEGPDLMPAAQEPPPAIVTETTPGGG